MYLIAERLLTKSPLADRPSFILSLIMIILGIQMFSLGLIAEYLSRIYYATVGIKPNVIEEILGI
jgi:hypothetical protein